MLSGPAFQRVNLSSLVTIGWAGPRSLAATYGISVDFFSSGYWDVSLHRVSRILSYLGLITAGNHDCGQVARAPLTSDRNIMYYNIIGYPIRKSPGQRVCAPHRRLSQLITSFIACWHQGIHSVPLLASSTFLLLSRKHWPWVSLLLLEFTMKHSYMLHCLFCMTILLFVSSSYGCFSQIVTSLIS